MAESSPENFPDKFAPAPVPAAAAASLGGGPPGGGAGLQRFAWFAGLLTLAYGWILFSLFRYAIGQTLHSHIVLIPLVSWYLIRLERERWPAAGPASWGGTLLMAGLGAGLLALGLMHPPASGGLSPNDYLAALTGSFLCFLLAGGFYFLGKSWLSAVAFPVGFLIFMIPLPDAFVSGLEHVLVAATSEVVDVFFMTTGVSYLRDGNVFQIPGITLEVARECSGIRSTVVLFITSLLASYLFLRSPWRRTLLVALVIPLGIVRNAFRILVLAKLCIHYGPAMIDSAIHHRGGPIFFALSLIPLFLLLWWLRKDEGKA